MLENQTFPPMNILPTLLLHFQLYHLPLSLGREFDVELYNGKHILIRPNEYKSINETQPEEAKRNMTTSNSSENKDVLGRGYAPPYDNFCIELLPLFVCLMSQLGLGVLYKLPWVALSCIDDVAAIQNNCCDQADWTFE